MKTHTDDEIRNMKKISTIVASEYLGISSWAVKMGIKNNLLPIGFAIKNEESYSQSWSYHIVPERLIAYKHGKINEVQVETIENHLSTIIDQFKELKSDLLFLLSEEGNQEK